MDEEKGLRQAQGWLWEKRIQETLKALKKNNMEGIYAKDRSRALKEILKRIPRNARVSHGGSYTIRELGLIDILNQGKYRYLRRHMAPSQPQTDESRLKEFSTDVYLTSVNAITLEGELLAMDGYGNRVACLFFGPKKVLVVAGRNKIVNTLEEGLNRIRDYAAPIHAKRRGWDLPCTKAGRCVNCKAPGRICNKLGIVQYEQEKGRMTVILVGEDLGI
jgi:hypothetical protein